MTKSVAHPVSDHLPAETGIQAKWNQCLKLLKEEISSQGFQTWISPIIPVSCVENTLILRVPSQFFFEWIESHYQQILLKTVKKIFGAAVHIEYLVASSGDKKPEELHLSDEEVIPNTSERPSHSSLLDNRYQFENFYVKNDNELALRAAQTVAKQPGKTDFNPLFIYGDSGCGKTHLLHAIGNYILLNKKRKKITYLSSENFLNQYISALQNKQVESFNNKFKETDVLLIDDIQILANKKKSQEGLFYFFSEFERQHKQIVITANHPPSQLTELDRRLLSFFQKGLIIDLITPSYETRLKFIQAYCQKTQLSILGEVKEFLASSLCESMQEIRAVMIRIAAQTSLLGKPVSLAATKKLLAHIDAKWANKNGHFRLIHQIKVDNIIKAVSEYLNIPTDVLIGQSRQREISFARQVAIYLAKELSGESLQVIGYHFNDRHYTAILHNYNRIRSEMKNNPAIYHLISEIRNQLVNQ